MCYSPSNGAAVLCSRFYALCKFVLVQLDCLYGALHRALEFYPKKVRTIVGRNNRL
jgi:hypothetical protein